MFHVPEKRLTLWLSKAEAAGYDDETLSFPHFVTCV